MVSYASKAQGKPQKLPQLPQNAKVSKRRLTRQPITSKSSSHKEQIIYVSSRTPFMSAISRIRKHVSQIQKRRSQSVVATYSRRGGPQLQKAKGDRILAAALESLERQDAAAASQGEVADDVLVKGTGKAIDKVLSVAGWLQDRAAEEGIKVRLETGSWWAVDDVEVVDNEVENGGAMDVHRKQGDEEEGVAGESDDVSDSRVRSVSVLTIRVTVL